MATVEIAMRVKGYHRSQTELHCFTSTMSVIYSLEHQDFENIH